MIDFVKLYARLVKAGAISISAVPDKFRDAVRKAIEEE